ncbi:MAG: hypothetical protein GY711_21925 [bacterium]|nr:hypothetical protein [bacterium]
MEQNKEARKEARRTARKAEYNDDLRRMRVCLVGLLNHAKEEPRASAVRFPGGSLVSEPPKEQPLPDRDAERLWTERWMPTAFSISAWDRSRHTFHHLRKALLIDLVDLWKRCQDRLSQETIEQISWGDFIPDHETMTWGDLVEDQQQIFTIVRKAEPEKFVSKRIAKGLGRDNDSTVRGWLADLKKSAFTSLSRLLVR